MIVLTEQIEIPASYEKLKAWTANFEEEFVKWSPYHIECNLYNGELSCGKQGPLPRDCYGAGLRCDRHDYGMRTG